MAITTKHVPGPGIFTEPGTAFTTLHARFPGPENHENRLPTYSEPVSCDAIVIGAGQAGLSVGYHLRRHGLKFVILEASSRIGDVWRNRWDTLRLFTPARFDGLDGMAFPASPYAFPTKDEMADYLEAYVKKFDLPVRTGMAVESVGRAGGRYVVTAGGRQYHASHVVIAAASYQKPRIPDFAGALDEEIRQLHSIEYRNPSQLKPGPVLLVGAGNSGAEIAMDIARAHKVLLSGRDVGQLPFRVGSPIGKRILAPLVLRGIFHRVLTVNTPIGRRFRPVFLSQGGPRIRTRRTDLHKMGVSCVPRMKGTKAGLPLLEDGTVAEVANVVWCTGFHPGLSWVQLPIFDADDRPRHEDGIVPGEAGLYFVGLHFLHSVTSTMIHGVGRDARRIADTIRDRVTIGAKAAA